MIMKAEDWINFCKAQSTMKCKKCGKILFGWKEVKKHKEDNWNHFEYEGVGIKMGICFA